MLYSLVVALGVFGLTSCDTVALEQALHDANNSSSYGDGRRSYDQGYYPYRPAHDHEHRSNHPRHPYQVGYRIGEDDFHHGYEKKYMMHEEMYDHETRAEFKKGYYAGFEDARDHSSHSRHH